MYDALRVNGLCICEHDFSSAIIALLKLPKPIFVSVDLYCTGIPTFVLGSDSVSFGIVWVLYEEIPHSHHLHKLFLTHAKGYSTTQMYI